MSGRTSGISTGAVSTWNPFGGGGAATSSGGGGSSFGGGGSSFFTSTKSTFSCFGPSSCCRGLRRRVDHEQDEAVVRDEREERSARLRCFFGFDSTRLLNMVLDRIGKRRVAGRRDSTTTA